MSTATIHNQVAVGKGWVTPSTALADCGFRPSRRRLHGRRGRVEHAGAALLAQPVALARDGQDVAVVQQPVEGGGGRRRLRHSFVSHALAA